jgi:starch phosphorylase
MATKKTPTAEKTKAATKKTATKKTATKKAAAKKTVTKKATTKQSLNSAADVQLKPAVECSNEQMQQAIVDRLRKGLGTSIEKANNKAWWNATCYAVNELVFDKLTKTQKNSFRF